MPIKEEHQIPDLMLNLAKDCVEMLHEASGLKGTKVTEKTEIAWNVFKNINQVCKKKIDYTGEYIEHYLTQAHNKNRASGA